MKTAEYLTVDAASVASLPEAEGEVQQTKIFPVMMRENQSATDKFNNDPDPTSEGT